MEKRRSKSATDLARYAGKWVALSRDRVIAAASSLPDVMRKVSRQPSGASPSLFLVPRRGEGPYVLFLMP